MLEIIITKEELYDKCENVEQLYDGFYYPLLVEYQGLKKQLEVLQQENKQLKDNWNKLKEYCQDNSFMQNTREYGTLTVVDADELAIYMEELESGDSNE